MKKKVEKRNFKKVSIICIIALLVAISTQFVTCWNYEGVTEDIVTNEKRVEAMDMNLASYVWFPMSEQSTAFTSYVADPSLRYVEKFTAERYSSKKIEEITNTLVEAEIISKPSKNSDEKTYDNSYSTFYGALIEIVEYNEDLFAKGQKTVMSKLGADSAIVKNYNEYVAGIDDVTVYNNYINKVVIFPAILFLGAIVGIVYTILVSLKKKKNRLAPSIFTLAIGVLNIVNLFTLPLFLLTTVKTFVILGIIYLIISLVGLFALLGDAKAIKAE